MAEEQLRMHREERERENLEREKRDEEEKRRRQLEHEEWLLEVRLTRERNLDREERKMQREDPRLW